MKGISPIASGGAERYICTEPLGTWLWYALVVERGRWASVKTARIYIAEAEAMLAATRLSALQQQQIAKGVANFERWCSG